MEVDEIELTYPSLTPLKQTITIYDISQLLLCVILFLHQFMVMLVARESALIFIDEKSRSAMSEMLRRANLYIQQLEYIPNANKANADDGAAKQLEPK